MSIGVPSGARRRSRAATSFATRMQPCETAWPSSSGRFVPWMPTMPLGQSVTRRVGARLEREGAVERIGRNEGRLDVEAPPERRLRAGRADRDDAAQQQRPSRTRRTSMRRCAEPHDDPVPHRSDLDRVRPGPSRARRSGGPGRLSRYHQSPSAPRRAERRRARSGTAGRGGSGGACGRSGPPGGLRANVGRRDELARRGKAVRRRRRGARWGAGCNHPDDAEHHHDRGTSGTTLHARTMGAQHGRATRASLTAVCSTRR